MKSSNSQWMQRAIDDLPLHYRETLLLCDEMSYQEIAEILSIPILEKSRAPEFGHSCTKTGKSSHSLCGRTPA
jgi:hypothetical protein